MEFPDKPVCNALANLKDWKSVWKDRIRRFYSFYYHLEVFNYMNEMQEINMYTIQKANVWLYTRSLKML
jgi:hypothetical protein